MSLKLAPNVEVLPVITTLSLSAERILKAALDSSLKDCLVIGHTQDGSFYFASTEADGGSVLWSMEQAKLKLMGVDRG